MIQPIAHYGIHFILPLLIAMLFYKKSVWKVYLIMIATMLIDLDHLLANPIFDPNRCSINFHPLHSYYAIGIFLLMLIPNKTRVLAIGLLIHILADSVDCLFM
ncbi:DUF6122 family protein [Flavobacteriaceae sp. LMIT009]